MEEGLDGFTGAPAAALKRRDSSTVLMVYDDYAHHPEELQRPADHGQGTWATSGSSAAFQPHTYSRTHEPCSDDFVDVLKLPDKTILAEIYAARETEHIWASPPRDLAGNIPGRSSAPRWRT